MGFGKVGTEVARRAKALGMNVIAHDPYASSDRASGIGVNLVSFEEAISSADFISLHMPLIPSTVKILNSGISALAHFAQKATLKFTTGFEELIGRLYGA
ncbi:hypothetical protein VNO78_32633 [Psophocarpus tetragonolobus]|uniref:D-isomer specific 2-hydroxyacid dehydrogenase NAD-binding domain-containing protein n=1 Tax=Psophocarpus tetragonolobus TaxID=3891 RepID=A0AAN9RKP8_PSOTE